MPNSAGRTLIGVANVLSMKLIRLCCFASAATFFKSTTRSVGFVGDSRYSILVFGRIARACCSYSVVSTNVVSMPNFGSHCPRNLLAPPYTSRCATMWSPLFSKASTGVVIAAIPEANNSAASAPSNSAMAASATVCVGLPYRV